MKKESKLVSLAMRWERARWLHQAGDDANAARELMALLERDPEQPAAWQMLSELYAARGLEQAAREYAAFARALSGESQPDSEIGQARRLLAGGEAAQAFSILEAALQAGRRTQLYIVLAARAAWQAGQIDKARDICQVFLRRWPVCVQLHITLADCLTAQGEHDRAVEHIRLARALDPEGQVQQRQSAVSHQPSAISYQLSAFSFQPSDLRPPTSDFRPPTSDLRPPTSDLRLPTSDFQPLTSDPDAVSAMRETIEQIVRWLNPQTPGRASKPRKPFHAILSAREALARVCGSRAAVVERAMADLAAAVTRHDGITAESLFIDDAGSLALFGLTPLQSCDAPSVKQLLDRLDDVLDLRGLQLASLLIVGGDEIIPFHRLPNPTEDQDADIPSDLPYACRNDNELVPERLVGRMLHGRSAQPDAAADMLLLQLGAALEARLERRPQAHGLWSWLTGRKTTSYTARSLGYTASIWRRAAQQVFDVIGPVQAMRLSPPLSRADAADLLAQTKPHLAYFNLHGLPDSPHWYGQRDPDFAADYEPFPIALSPTDIQSPARVVFTAACYGVHISNRDAGSSIALRFMQSGTLALVGSTTVAYGGLDKPLVGVDLLARLFWEHLMNGYSSGQALRQAQIGFVNQMQNRQGYLDGEDLKTLYSFILLGDPLCVPLPIADNAPAATSNKQPAVLHAPVLCVNGVCRPARVPLSPEQLEQIKQHIAHLIPDMAQATIQPAAVSYQPLAISYQLSAISHSLSDLRLPTSDFRLPTSDFRLPTSDLRPPLTISLSKPLPYADRQAVQLVRVTMDGAGKIVKVAMSR